MDVTELLDQGLAWTAARIAAVPADGLDAPTPCGSWNVRELLDHTIDVLTMLTDAVDTASADADSDVVSDPEAGSDGGEVRLLGPSPWGRAIADLVARSRRVWLAPGVMDRTFELPIGAMSAPVVASSVLLEAVVHGWDVSQASGEAAEIPDALAVPVLEFAREAIVDADRGDNFSADRGTGATPSEQLVAFLGREPL